MKKANETTAYREGSDGFEYKRLYVENLGDLLTQTREGVTGCHLFKEGTDLIVAITFRGGTSKLVNVNMDSYLAITLDVVKAVI